MSDVGEEGIETVRFSTAAEDWELKTAAAARDLDDRRALRRVGYITMDDTTVLNVSDEELGHPLVDQRYSWGALPTVGEYFAFTVYWG